MTGNLASVDIATKENLEGLVKVGERLLDKPASKINLDKGVYEAVENGGTNKEALRRCVHLSITFIHVEHSSLYINC